MLRLVCMFDKKAETFTAPICTPGIGQLARAIGESVNASDKSETFAKHPGDFQLFDVGSFDETTGRLIPIVPKLILELSSLVE